MPDQPFFAMMHTYPWDLTDEGLDTSLGRLADLAGCQEVMLTPCYHQSTYFLPHNPKRPVYYGDDGAVYFSPELKRYEKTSIRPFVSDVVETGDYYERIVEAINKRGLAFGTWIVYTFQTNLSRKYPQFARHDAFGNPHRGALSVAPVDVQEYFLALTSDIIDRFKPSAVIVESLMRRGFSSPPKRRAEMALRHQFLLGVDFNPAAVAKATSEGVDAEALQTQVANWLASRLARTPTPEDELPVTVEWVAEAFGGRLKQYMDACRKDTTAHWQNVAKVIRASGAKLQTPVATEESAMRNDLGIAINGRIDRVPTTSVSTGFEGKQAVSDLAGQIAPDGVVMADLGPKRMTDAGPLIKDVQAAKEAGAAGAMFYNYGLLREEDLGFIGEAMRSVA